MMPVLMGEIPITKATGTGNLSEGDGSEENPFKIQSIEDLCTLSSIVRNRQLYYQSYNKKNYIIERNLDFKNELSYIDANGTSFGDINKNGTVEGLMTELTTGEGFQSIGTYDGRDYYVFEGVLDGNGKTIVNFYQNKNNSYQGLFGYGNNVSIHNLNLKDVNLTYMDCSAGLVGNCSGQRNSINNINITGSVKGEYRIGSLIGSNNCAQLEITNLNNYAEIQGKWYIGGLIGKVESADNVNLSNCSNNNKISAEGSTGGIIGQHCNGEIKIENVLNYGDVIGTSSNIGGVIGEIYNGKRSELKKCSNFGKVLSSNSSNAGGLIGYTMIDNNQFFVEGCSNHNEVSAKGSSIGGLVGNCSMNGGSVYITNSNNESVIVTLSEYGDCVGGLFGSTYCSYISVSDCHNKGDINAYGSCGGIVGSRSGNNNSYAEFKNCYNIGEIGSGGYSRRNLRYKLFRGIFL